MKKGNLHREIELTPQLFKELDFIARTEGGSVIEVMNTIEIGGRFGAKPVMAGDVYIDLNKDEMMCNASMIYLVDKINVSDFQATVRPEMDWSSIPVNCIYHFVLYHEIGHFRLDPMFTNMIIRKEDGTIDREKTLKLWQACELRADRYAWNKLFPGEELPKSRRQKSLLKELEAFIENNKRLFPARPRDHKVIPTETGKFVPVSHVKIGIFFKMEGEAPQAISL